MEERGPARRTAKGPPADARGRPASRIRRHLLGADCVLLSRPAHEAARRVTLAPRSPTDGVPPDGRARPRYAVRMSRCVVLSCVRLSTVSAMCSCFVVLVFLGVLAAIIWFPLGIALCLLDRRVRCERCGETLEDGLCS